MLPSTAAPSVTPLELIAPVLRIDELTRLPFLNHGFSTRACGNVATRYGAAAEVAAARRTFARVVGIDPQHVAHFALTHSSRVGLVGESDAMAIDEKPHRISIRGLLVDASPHDLNFTNAQGVPNQQGVDCLVTTSQNVALFMVVGDAAPVILTTRNGKAVALAHVGLAGTVNHILEHAIEALCSITGSRTSDVIAGIGPTVGSCCYALAQSITWGQVVAPHFFKEFGPNGPGIVLREGQYYFDLPAAITDILRREGVLASQIFSSGLCTACDNSPFFPHSRGVAGRFGTLVSLRG